MNMCICMYVLQGLLALYGVVLGPSLMTLCFSSDSENSSCDDTNEKGNEDAPVPIGLDAEGKDAIEQNADTEHKNKCVNLKVCDWLKKWKLELDGPVAVITAVIFPASVIIVYIILGAVEGNTAYWSVPLSIILVSARYWENYIGDEARYDCFESLRKHLEKVRKKTRKHKVGNQLIANVWKIVFTFLLMPLFVGHHITDLGYSQIWTAMFQSDLSQRFAKHDRFIIIRFT